MAVSRACPRAVRVAATWPRCQRRKAEITCEGLANPIDESVATVPGSSSTPVKTRFPDGPGSESAASLANRSL